MYDFILESDVSKKGNQMIFRYFPGKKICKKTRWSPTGRKDLRTKAFQIKISIIFKNDWRKSIWNSTPVYTCNTPNYSLRYFDSSSLFYDLLTTEG